MADAFSVRRKLHIHPAHLTIGVSGGGMMLRPYYRFGDSPAETSHARPLRVLLVDRGLDANHRATALLEEQLRRRSDVQCRRAEFVAADARPKDFANADCVVVLGQGIQMAGHWSDLDAGMEAEADDERPMVVEPVAAACWHPVLDEVQPFTARRGVGRHVGMSAGATCLLRGKAADAVRPIAWVRRGCRGRVFGAALGCHDDFQDPNFLRLVLNAIDWIGQADVVTLP